MKRERQIRAVVFDMDGLMFDSEPLYYELTDVLLRRRGHRMSQELANAMMGRRRDEALNVLKSHCGLLEATEALAREAEELYFELVGSRLRPMPGLLRLLDALHATDVPRAVATSSARTYVEYGLKRWELQERFAFVLAAEDVDQGKPHPEIYEKAAQRFGIAASAMLVLEDSQNGLRAAKAAGAVCVVVPQRHNQGQDFSAADALVPALDAPELLELAGLAARASDARVHA